ncbi:glycosyltransferase [Marinagarivorans algicola]|uniref:glycosyltransferase n=1 Tax=Marinagarivorans algicola TaxID=1513270 RepID=UPI00373679BA
MKKIILTSNAYYPSIGGIENSLRHLAVEAKQEGYDPIIVVGDIGLDVPLKAVREEVIDDINIIRYPLSQTSKPFLRWFNIFTGYFICWRIYKKIYKESPNTIVVARFHFNAVLAILSGFRQVSYLVPSINKNQSAVEIKESRNLSALLGSVKILLHNIIQRKALRSCNNFVFSETMLKQCIELAGNSQEDYTVVKPGVDGDRFFTLSKRERLDFRLESGLPADKILLLFVGRFVKAKGVDLLIKAVAKSRGELFLVMVGEGEEKTTYEALIADLNIGNSTRIYPPSRNVEKYYRLADAFVMSSCYEPLGQTLLEAFASGLNVVAFRRSVYVDTATEELGMDQSIFYASSFDEISLASTLEGLGPLLDEDASMTRSRALEKFSWVKLLNDLIG